MAAGKNIKKYDQKSITDWDENAQINSSRILQLLADAHVSNEDMASSTFEQMDQINPYRLWHVTAFNNLSGNDKHWHICYDCYFYLHYGGNRYDIVISSLDPKSKAGDDVRSPEVEMYSSALYVNSQDISEALWRDLCLTGVSTVERGPDLWDDQDFDSRQNMQVGSKHTVIAWGVKGFCGHNEDATRVRRYGVLVDELIDDIKDGAETVVRVVDDFAADFTDDIISYTKRAAAFLQ